MIETERLVISPIRLSDIKDIFDYVSDPIQMRFERTAFTNQKEVEQHIKWFVKNQSAYAVRIKEQEKVIGQVTFTSTSDLDGVYSIGYIMNRNFEGKGYCTEAVRAVIDYGFTSLGAIKIVATCNPENIASWKVLEKIGMTRIEQKKNSVSYRHDKEGNSIYTDQYLYELTR